MSDDKPTLHAPEACPFCGTRIIGGGTSVAYYACGAHIWLVRNGEWVEIRGHDGMPCDVDREHMRTEGENT